MKNIEIYTSQDDRYNDKNRYYGTYLHGDIETDFEYDIFCFAEKQNFETVIHKFLVNDKPTTFFVWKSSYQPEASKRAEWRGLVVYDSDVQNYEYAQQQFGEESSCL